MNGLLTSPARKRVISLTRLGGKVNSIPFALSVLVLLLLVVRFRITRLPLTYKIRQSMSESADSNSIDTVSELSFSQSMSESAGADVVDENPDLSSSKHAFPLFFFMTRVKTSVALLLSLTAASNPDASLYMLTSSDTPPEDSVSQELRNLGVKVILFDPNPSPGSRIDEFRQHYKHHSVNELWYERLCYERFLILEDVVVREGIERFYYFDADTVFFKDLRDTPYTKHLDKDLVGLTHLSSYNSLWRIDALQKFCKYLLWFYQRPNELLNKDIERWGEWVFPWDADRTNTSQRVRQFSDMYLFSAFLQTHNFSRILLLYEIEIPLKTQLIAIDHPDGLRHRGEKESICSSVEAFDSYLKWRKLEDGRQVPYYNETALAGLQFEGTCKREVMPHVLRKHFPERSDADFQWL